MVLPGPHVGPEPRLIQDGDLVVVYENINSIKSVYVSSKATFQNRYGAFPQKDWVGKPFGVRVTSRPPQQGWVYLLAPTAELWTLVLRHRTQILYVADIALVVAGLDLRPGCTVLESGTGSGSLSHSLARAVAPTGQLLTFEFHPARAQEAAVEFEKNGLGGLVKVTQRNIEAEGFPSDQLAGAAQAVFLDLPAPWKVVPSAAACLAPDGRFCSFSPCIEQVQRTVEALDDHGFTDIATQEILLRSYEVTADKLATIFGTSGSAARAGNAWRREQQPSHQAKVQQQEEAAAAAAAAAGGHKRKREGEAEGEAEAGAPDQPDAGGGGGCGDAAPAAAARSSDAGPSGAPPEPCRVVLAKPIMEARGHTGYLTFARKFVVPAGAAAAQPPTEQAGGDAAASDAAPAEAAE